MVASAARRREPFSGLRPIDVSRDLRSIADLITEAFRDDMDPAGERAVREMRSASRWAFLFGWIDRVAPPGEGIVPGFVWVEDDRIVGNISVRRIGSLGRGWMIGNVAVSKGWRRRGIARSLMSAAIDLARQRHGEWIALQVRSDSEAARNLYHSLGFKVVGETIQFWRTRPVVVAPPAPLLDGRLRRGHAADAHRLYTLAQAAIPQELRWAEPLRRDEFWLGPDRSLSNWLAGRREAWHLIDSGEGIRAAAHLEIPRRPNPGRLSVWAAPAYQGRYEDHLVRAALASIGGMEGHSVSASVPATQMAAHRVLEAVGFDVRRRLTHMRLDLR